MDFLDSPERIAEQLRLHEIKADYIFFFAYIQPPPKEGGSIWSAVDDLVRVNSEFLLAKSIAVCKQFYLTFATQNSYW